MSAHTGRLLLTPQDPFLLPNAAALHERLHAAGLLGDPLPDRPGAHLVGEGFLQLVSFAGCSVQVELAPTGSAGTPFCHVRFAGPFERPRFASGRNTRPPRCSACRSPLRDWRAHLSPWNGGADLEIRCPGCGESRPPWAYDWKENAGFGRLLLMIEEIFPGEALPTPTLMALLAEVTGSGWRYFYVQDAESGGLDLAPAA